MTLYLVKDDGTIEIENEKFEMTREQSIKRALDLQFMALNGEIEKAKELSKLSDADYLLYTLGFDKEEIEEFRTFLDSETNKAVFF